MFDKYDPGFLAGFIGMVMAYTFTFIFRQINIIYHFSESLKMLDDKVKASHRIVPMDTDSGVLLRELFKEASDMVKEGRNVSRFNLIRRYQKSKRMAKLILDIENERTSLLLEIVIHQTGAVRNLATNLQMGARMDAAEEQAMAHTHALGQTAAAEEQAMAHTHAVEQTGKTGLRQRVGTRTKIVAIHDVKCEKCKGRRMEAVAGLEGVESVAVDMESNKFFVSGEADPVLLLETFRKYGYAELLSVDPAKED